jgi:hypothetical protein
MRLGLLEKQRRRERGANIQAVIVSRDQTYPLTHLEATHYCFISATAYSPA